MNLKPLYLPVNALFGLSVIAGASLGASASPRIVYLILLFALCTLPALSVQRLNDRFSLLGLFTVIYFLFFGVIDYEAVIGLSDLHNPGSGILDATEAVILVGGAAFIAAYYAVAGWRESATQSFERDWSEPAILFVGVGLLLAGATSDIVLQLFVMPDKTATTATRGFIALGPYVTALLILGNYVRGLGIVCVAYGYAKHPTRFWFVLVIVMLISQVFLGLLIDVKNTALIGGVLVVLTLTLVQGRVPWRWAAIATLAAMFIFPVLQAYRHVIAEGNTTRGAAAENFGKYLEQAFATRKQVTQGRATERAESIFERTNMKPSVDIAVSHTGVDVDPQGGDTIAPVLTALIPRILMPNKPDSAVGILFNKEFRLGAAEDTYISPSHLGELYWNFGWGGALFGMLLIGALFGWIGRTFDLSRRATVTRLLVYLSTLSLLGIGFESSIATQYSVWIRTVLLVLILHGIFARAAPAARDLGTGTEEAPASSTPAFPNLLR